MNPIWRVAIVALAHAFRLYAATLRVRVALPDQRIIRVDDYVFGPDIFALSERDIILVALVTMGRPFTVLVAYGRDGDWASTAARALGHRVVRGSSRLGGAQALIELGAGLSQSPHPAALVVDGPLGPAGYPKPGIILLAARTLRAVRPIGARVKWRIVFKRAWSQIYLPLPFSRVWIVVGDPCVYGPPASPTEIETAVEDLARRLASAHQAAAAMAARS
jgi:lysophospholipid acyltransferase (LPLAT)-like uncharacterized protein